MADWYYATGGKSNGPVPDSTIKEMIKNGSLSDDTPIFGPGMAGWTKVKHLPQFTAATTVPVPPSSISAGQVAHEIDYQVFGAEMQYVEIELDPGESAVAEAGAMMYMTSEIQMTTIFGDGSGQDQGGLMGKLLGAGKRLITGESLFTTVFTHAGNLGKQKVAFAAPYPGKIIPVDLRAIGGKLICQKDAFLSAAKGVSIGVHFQKKIGVGLFGGEGFIMQKLEGDGLVFVHAGGTIVKRELSTGETLRVDTGCIVALMPTVEFDIEFVGGVKSAIFGGEGFFFATLRGPGTVWLQSLPFSRLAGRMRAAAASGGKKDEGSILGGLSGIGGLLDD
jgi:uncharacterized protein (TIGR00266 family)